MGLKKITQIKAHLRDRFPDAHCNQLPSTVGAVVYDISIYLMSHGARYGSGSSLPHAWSEVLRSLWEWFISDAKAMRATAMFLVFDDSRYKSPIKDVEHQKRYGSKTTKVQEEQDDEQGEVVEPALLIEFPLPTSSSDWYALCRNRSFRRLLAVELADYVVSNMSSYADVVLWPENGQLDTNRIAVVISGVDRQKMGIDTGHPLPDRAISEFDTQAPLVFDLVRTHSAFERDRSLVVCSADSDLLVVLLLCIDQRQRAGDALSEVQPQCYHLMSKKNKTIDVGILEPDFQTVTEIECIHANVFARAMFAEVDKRIRVSSRMSGRDRTFADPLVLADMALILSFCGTDFTGAMNGVSFDKLLTAYFQSVGLGAWGLVTMRQGRYSMNQNAVRSLLLQLGTPSRWEAHVQSSGTVVPKSLPVKGVASTNLAYAVAHASRVTFTLSYWAFASAPDWDWATKDTPFCAGGWIDGGERSDGSRAVHVAASFLS